mgnify:CR=1 FL=1
MRLAIATLVALFATAASGQEMERTAAPENASVYIISPAAGETVTSPVTVKFGLSGMGVAPAGVEQQNTGHHHLLIDIDDDSMPPLDRPLPATDQVRHFGGGQTEVTLDLAAGEHTLQLLLGDHLHLPHQPPVMSERITITVE